MKSRFVPAAGPSMLVAGLMVIFLPSAGAEPGFQALHDLIKRAPGESRWMEIDWYPSVWEGRQRAAREGKPLFLMAGSGGAPCAGC